MHREKRGKNIRHFLVVFLMFAMMVVSFKWLPIYKWLASGNSDVVVILVIFFLFEARTIDMHCVCIINCVLFRLLSLDFFQFLCYSLVVLDSIVMLLLLSWKQFDRMKLNVKRPDHILIHLLCFFCLYTVHCVINICGFARDCVCLFYFLSRGFSPKNLWENQDSSAHTFPRCLLFTSFSVREFVDLNQYNLFNLNNVMSVLWKLIINLLSLSPFGITFVCALTYSVYDKVLLGVCM